MTVNLCATLFAVSQLIESTSTLEGAVACCLVAYKDKGIPFNILIRSEFTSADSDIGYSWLIVNSDLIHTFFM